MGLEDFFYDVMVGIFRSFCFEMCRWVFVGFLLGLRGDGSVGFGFYAFELCVPGVSFRWAYRKITFIGRRYLQYYYI